jgi:hypothetical protein
MSIRFDEKGKYYTDIVSKTRISVIIQTTQSRITGDIHVLQDERVSNSINRSEEFMAITDAVIFDEEGNEDQRTEFMLVNRNHVIWILPFEEAGPDTQPNAKDQG